MTPPLKWHGGKHYLAKKILELAPPHTHYVEPFFGGGAVLLAKNPKGVSEVVNDIDLELTDFWRCLAHNSEFQNFVRLAQVTPFSEYEFRAAAEDVTHGRAAKAMAFFVRCRQSLSGRMKDFAILSRNRTRRGMNEQVSAWLTAIEGLPEVHERLKRVVILNRPALDVIKSQDGPNTWFYCDPPYLGETRSSKNVYNHEMTKEDHIDLLHALIRVDAKVTISGYPSPLYSSFLDNRFWRRVDIDIPNNAAGGKSKRRMTECLWMNY